MSSVVARASVRTSPARAAEARRRGVPRRAGRLLPLGASPLVLFLLAMLVAPVCLLVLYSFWEAGFFVVVHRFTSANYTSIFEEAIYWRLILKSLGVGLVCGGLMVVFGFAMAYAMTFRLARWGPRILILVMATLLSSYVVRIYAWKTILGTNGLLNEALIRIGLIDQPLGFLLYGYFAIIVTLVYVYLPIVVLPIYAGPIFRSCMATVSLPRITRWLAALRNSAIIGSTNSPGFSIAAMPPRSESAAEAP